MKIAAALLLTSVIAVVATGSSTLQYKATNKATGEPGGIRFDKEIGLNYSKQVLATASSFIWCTLGQASPQARKNVTVITLTVESMSGIAYTIGNEIHMSSDYIGNYTGDVRTEFTGIMYHETTHVWQWFGDGKAPSGLIEGIADYVRLKAGYAPANWVKPGEGRNWDQGYDVTARFLDYCNEKRNGFVAELNAQVKSGYSDDCFKKLLGKSVDKLWKEYKAQYGG